MGITKSDIEDYLEDLDTLPDLEHISILFKYHEQEKNVIGIHNIFLHIDADIKAWEDFKEKLNIESLPGEFNRSYLSLIELKESIIDSLSDINARDDNQYKDAAVLLRIVNNFNTRKRQLLHDPFNFKVRFLIESFHGSELEFKGAYNFLYRNVASFGSTNELIGILKAYEFISPNSKTDQRKIILEESLESIIDKFEKHYDDSVKTIKSNNDELIQTYKRNLVEIVSSHTKSLTESHHQVTQAKDDFVKYVSEANEQRTNLEKTYSELLKLKEPAKYWKKKALNLKIQGWVSLVVLLGLVFFSAQSLYEILWNSPQDIYNRYFNGEASIAIRWSILLAAFLAFTAFGIKAITKFMFSCFHLARDAEERYSLTYLYLSLSNEGKVNEEDRNLVLQSLFSRTDSGLLKGDNSPEMPGAAGVISKFTTGN